MSSQHTPPETQQWSNDFTMQYDSKPRRDVVGEILVLALVTIFLAVIGYVLYSTHGDYKKTMASFDTLLRHWPA